MKTRLLSVVAATLLAAASAQAAPVYLSYSGQVSGGGTGLPGTAMVGDVISMVVTADNGGSSLLSQTWAGTDVLSATFSAGSYSATTSGPLVGGFGSFVSDAAGNLSSLDLEIDQAGTDTAGYERFLFYMNGGNDFWFTMPIGDGAALTSIAAVAPPDIFNTSLSLDPPAVPLPATGILLIAALGGLWMRRRAA